MILSYDLFRRLCIEMYMYSAAFEWNIVCVCVCVSIKSIWSNMSFKTSVFLLIFFLDGLLIDVSGVLKSSNSIMLLFISPFVCLIFALCI